MWNNWFRIRICDSLFSVMGEEEEKERGKDSLIIFNRTSTAFERHLSGSYISNARHRGSVYSYSYPLTEPQDEEN